MSAPSIARYAARYCEIGLALTWTPFGQKGPRHAGWCLPEHAITDPKRAFGYWHLNPEHGIAALLGPSGLVSLDIDDEQFSPRVLKHFGIDLEQLRESTPTIVGRHFRLMFRAPAARKSGAENSAPDSGASFDAGESAAQNYAPESSAEISLPEKRLGRDGKQYTAPTKVETPAVEPALKHRSATWPKQDGPGNFVLFELRAGALADTLPPTRHAVTGLPYRWENAPKQGFPPLPSRLLEIWENWETTNREIRALCPWWTPPPDLPPVRTERKDRGESVIAAFNAVHDAATILKCHGYKKRDKRFISPDSGHAAGIVLLDSGKIFCHHQGDVLSSEHALDAFDCFRLLDFGGDYRAAVKAAAQALGLDRERAA